MTVLATRKQRRKEAKENGVKFAPQYNGAEPFRGQNKDVLKNQRNAEKYNEKQKLRKGA